MTIPSGPSDPTLPAAPATSHLPSPAQRTDWVAAALRGRVRQGPSVSEGRTRRGLDPEDPRTA